jgi:NADH-quinone oxidoreductase subunit G
MPTITIDGNSVTVEADATVIQAAEKCGIYIPRYCYHPGLPIAGSCRMCLVEVANIPKLQVACYTRVQDGMQVITNSDQVKKARQSMLEFLLSNHPLDCPVCDQSGECELQNFYMEHGRYLSRYLENKIKRRKAFPIGPHVVLDQERCILCTRCVRFTEQVSRSNELGVFNRGNRSVIDLVPGTSLDNPYSGNVIDICPVGALTERDFRFKCRVWYLSTAQSICNGCSRGCNTTVSYNENRQYKAQGRRVMRVQPRFNPDVNKWWICDRGRFGYGFVDLDRIEFPQLRETARLEPCDWSPAIHTAADLIRSTIEAHGAGSVGVIVSPQLSNEELLYCKQLFVEGLGLTRFALDNPWEEAVPEDDLLRRADPNPNAAGARHMGFGGDAGDLLKAAAAGKLKLLYVFSHDFQNPAALELLKEVEKVVYQGTNWNATAELADVVLASATHFETSGTFTNFEGRVQRFNRAVPPLEDSLPGTEILSRLARECRISMPENPDQALEGWLGVPADAIGATGQLLDSAAASRS